MEFLLIAADAGARAIALEGPLIRWKAIVFFENASTGRLYHGHTQSQRVLGLVKAFNGYFFDFTAIAEISMRALLTRPATWTVARVGLGSGMTLL